MLEYARTMCACRHRACADTIHTDMKRWSEENRVLAEEGRAQRTGSTVARADDPDEVRLAPEMLARMHRIGEHYGTCWGAAKDVP